LHTHCHYLTVAHVLSLSDSCTRTVNYLTVAHVLSLSDSCTRTVTSFVKNIKIKSDIFI